MNLLREFDLEYWQMREALGFPIPDRIDRRWPRKLSGNGGVNPFECGKCNARKRYPGVNIAVDLLNLHDRLTISPFPLPASIVATPCPRVQRAAETPASTPATEQ